MSKVGILTEYFNSYNYGGVLQSYALCKVLEKLGYDSEQIQYQKKKDKEKNGIKLIPNQLKALITSIKYHQRTQSFDKFRDIKVKHSDSVYTDENITKSVNDYEAFIVGSDQVWNPNLYNKAYYLEFVPDNKIKISYAASLSVFELTEEQRQLFNECLKSFDAISVRERNAIYLLDSLTNKQIEWVLDPTLLLSKDDWDKLKSDRKIKDKYVFVYFLGSDPEIKKLVKEYALIKNLKIVYMPLVFGWKSGFDGNFGDIRLFDVSPEDFISLIDQAEAVFTDSFHAVVFSHIYNTNFYAFKRSDHTSMASRLYNITDLFCTQSHFCDNDTKMSVKYLLEHDELKIDNTLYEKQRQLSMEFLNDSLFSIAGDIKHEN